MLNGISGIWIAQVAMISLPWSPVLGQSPVTAQWHGQGHSPQWSGTAVTCILVSMTAVAYVHVQIWLNGRSGSKPSKNWDSGCVHTCPDWYDVTQVIRAHEMTRLRNLNQVGRCRCRLKLISAMWIGHDKGRPLYMSMLSFSDDFDVDQMSRCGSRVRKKSANSRDAGWWIV